MVAQTLARHAIHRLQHREDETLPLAGRCGQTRIERATEQDEVVAVGRRFGRDVAKLELAIGEPPAAVLHEGLRDVAAGIVDAGKPGLEKLAQVTQPATDLVDTEGRLLVAEDACQPFEPFVLRFPIAVRERARAVTVLSIERLVELALIVGDAHPAAGPSRPAAAASSGSVVDEIA